MDIQVDSGLIAQAAAESIEKGVKSAFDSWNVQKVIQEHATNAILESAIATAVNEAVEMVEVKSLAVLISEQLLEQIKTTASMVLEDAAVNTIYGMRHQSQYIPSEKETEYKTTIRKEIRARREVI
jgi:aldehyde:ferredoxin oxidoreductase